MSQSKGIDILAINETKLDSTIKDNEVSGYDVIRKVCENNCRDGGGVCITFQLISGLNALLLRLRNLDPRHSLCPLGTDHHTHLLTFSRSLRRLLIKSTLRVLSLS